MEDRQFGTLDALEASYRDRRITDLERRLAESEVKLAALRDQRRALKDAVRYVHRRMVMTLEGTWPDDRQEASDLAAICDAQGMVISDLQRDCRESEAACGAMRAVLMYAGVGEPHPFNRLIRVIQCKRAEAHNPDDQLFWATVERRLMACVASDAGKGWHSPTEPQEGGE